MASPFKRHLAKLAKAPFGDSLVLCSGYIWEPGPASGGYKVLDDLLRPIHSGCAGGKVTTVAGKLGYSQYKQYYRNFVQRLRAEGLKVDAFVAPSKNWHAKIAIRTSGGVPQAAIVGSSNLTSPAVREGRGNWNYEGDILIWKDEAASNAYFRNVEFGDSGRVIDVILDPAITQDDEEGQLNALYHDVMESPLEAFE